jgi:hypothetical protein
VRHPLWYRVLVAIWGLLFTTALSEPAGAHTCPMHGGHAGHAMQVGSVAAHAGHEGHHAPAKQSSNTCTCLGQCCSAPPVALPAASTELVAALVVDVRAAEYGSVTTLVTRRAHSLPFANGPPNSLAL